MKEDNLTQYRRHLKRCKHQDKGQSYQACSCPIWAYGTLNGKPCRKSLELRDWARAEAKVKAWLGEPTKVANDATQNRTLKQAVHAFIEDSKTALAPGTVQQYEIVLVKHLLKFATEAGIIKLHALDAAAIADYAKSRKVSASTLTKELKLISAFLAWCKRSPRKWITENPTTDVRRPKVDSAPTLPFTRDEVTRLIRAADGYGDGWRSGTPDEKRRAELRALALILFMLYTGMRIGDITQFRRDRLNLRTGKILLRVEKTKAPVYLALNPDALAALAALPVESDYFFWNGRSKRAAAVNNCRRIFDRLAVRAGIVGAHPHRCRDTFAIELLLNGVDIRTVQNLLGHKSLRTTERYYAPWVLAFQDHLDAATARLDFSSAVLPVIAGEDASGNAQSNIRPFVPVRYRTA